MISQRVVDQHAQLTASCQAQRPGREFEIVMVTKPCDLDCPVEMRVIWKRKSRKVTAPDPNQMQMFTN